MLAFFKKKRTDEAKKARNKCDYWAVNVFCKLCKRIDLQHNTFNNITRISVGQTYGVIDVCNLLSYEVQDSVRIFDSIRRFRCQIFRKHFFFTQKEPVWPTLFQTLFSKNKVVTFASIKFFFARCVIIGKDHSCLFDFLFQISKLSTRKIE